MSNFKVNGTDLDDLLMQSTNRHTNATNFSISNNDLINKYGKWDNLERNKVAATRYTVGNKDINEYFNKRDPTFQATLSGEFEYTGRNIQPNISVSPASTTEYEITYIGSKKDVASYLAVERDFILPPGYVWDTNHPQGSFTIYHKSVSFTFTGTGSFEYNGSPRSIIIIPNDSNATYSITNGSVGPKTNVSDGSTTVTVTANGNYSGSATSASLSITPKPVTITITGGGTFEYNELPRSMSYSLNDTAASSSVSTSGTSSITNVGTTGTYTVSLSGNYSGSASSSITITQKQITLTLSGTGSFEYNSTISRSMSVLYGGNSFSSYQIISGSLGPITNVSQSPISVTVQANGNYSSSQVSGTITITRKPVTVTINGGGTFAYNASQRSMTYSLSDSAAASSVSTSGTNIITNGGTTGIYTVSLTGNYSGSSSGTINIVQALITSQPTGGTAGSGGSVSLSVTGSGLPSGGSISYQWYTSSGSIVSGATNSSYSASTSGSYYCNVTYTYNSVAHTVSSSVATATISAAESRIGITESTTDDSYRYTTIFSNVIYTRSTINAYIAIENNSVFDVRLLTLPSEISINSKINTINNNIYYYGITATFGRNDTSDDERILQYTIIYDTSRLTWNITQGGCFKYGTLVLMADNTWKNIEDIIVGDEVVSATIPTLPIKESPSYFTWWNTSSLNGMERVTATISSAIHLTVSIYYKINDIIEVTGEHRVLAKKLDDIWKFYTVNELEIGDIIINDNDEEIEITTKIEINEKINIVSLDLDIYDLFYVKGLLSHNAKATQ